MTDEHWTNNAYSENPLSLLDLSRAYNLLNQKKPLYDFVAVPKSFVKKIDFISDVSFRCLWGVPIIVRPEPKRKGLFKWRLFRVLFSSTENIIKEWHWNCQFFLVSKERCCFNAPQTYSSFNLRERVQGKTE